VGRIINFINSRRKPYGVEFTDFEFLSPGVFNFVVVVVHRCASQHSVDFFRESAIDNQFTSLIFVFALCKISFLL
jgi:hypothetical protein